MRSINFSFKLFLAQAFICLLFSPITSYAGWKYYDTSSNDDVFFYDDASVEKNGPIVKLWAVTDSKRRDETGALSNRSKLVIDCANQSYGMTFLSSYSENGLKGNSLFNDYTSGKMYPIAPTSSMKKLSNIVCK